MLVVMVQQYKFYMNMKICILYIYCQYQSFFYKKKLLNFDTIGVVNSIIF